MTIKSLIYRGAAVTDQFTIPSVPQLNDALPKYKEEKTSSREVRYLGLWMKIRRRCPSYTRRSFAA